MNSNPKINLTDQDKETYAINVLTRMILNKEHKDLMKKVHRKAKRIYKKILKQDNKPNS